MKSINKFHFHIIVFFILILFLFNSCSNEKKIKLTIGYIPIAECVQLYVANDLEYFKSEGIEVELLSYAGGANILNALNAGKVDVGFSNVVSLVLFNSNKSNLYSIFGATYETYANQNHALLIRSELVKNTPKETFRNLKIAVNTRQNVEELMVNKYLKSIGLEPNEVTKEPIGFPRMLPMLENKTIDVASIVEPFITINSSDTTSKITKYINHYLATTDKSLVATYVTSQKVYEEKKEFIEKFNKAMTRATEYIRTNELKAREIIGRYTKIPKELLAKVGLPEFDNQIDPKKLDDVILDMLGYGYISKENVKKTEEMIINF